MQTPEPVHAEAARYTTSLLFLPGLWAGPELWRGVATYLAHRGWEGGLADLRTATGDIASRAQQVADYAAGLPAPPVLIGHDAGGLVALAAARRGPSAAVVLVAPFAPGRAVERAMTLGIAPLLALLRRRPVPAPEGWRAARLLGDLPGAARVQLGADDPAAIWDLTSHRALVPAVKVPTLLVVGDRDPLLPLPAARALAATVSAEEGVVEGAGHWPHVGPTWSALVNLVHRWLIQRLGEPLLERYADAMAERDADDDA
ncbi:MAG TPA: alpha/beta fold hydrolase [Candidatus Nitrosopolaris sp.]|nr:alpha/beta fold hydrolase [Candidatus Nitrosopolaris sp.]